MGGWGSLTLFTVTIHPKVFAVLLSHVLSLRSLVGRKEIPRERTRMMGTNKNKE